MSTIEDLNWYCSYEINEIACLRGLAAAREILLHPAGRLAHAGSEIRAVACAVSRFAFDRA